MKRIFGFALALALLAPAAADAQGPGAERGRPAFQPHPPIARLIERRAELNLTDDQVRRLQEIQTRLQEQVRPLHEQMQAARTGMTERPMMRDSVRPREMTAEQREQMRAQMAERRAAMRARMEETRPVREELRKHMEQAREDVHAVLTPEQREVVKSWRPARGERKGGMEGMRKRQGERRPVRGGVRG